MTRDIIDRYARYIYKHNLTQTDAAEKIGCSQEHLSRILKGTKNPSVKLLDKMEQVMEKDNG